MLRTAGGLTVNQTTQFGGYYGAFYSTVDQTDGVNTEILMAVENTYDSNGVSVVANDAGKKTQVTFANAGTYNVQFSTLFHDTGGGGAGKTVNVYFKHNGTALANSNTLLSIANSAPYVAAAWNFVISVSAGDYVELAWYTANSNIQCDYIAAFDGVPATPSIIITATQVA